MKVLILSCNTGQGHNAAGKAILETLISRGIDCQMMDALKLAGDKVSRHVSNAYSGLTTRFPAGFEWLYKAGGVISTSRWKSPVYLANIPYARRLLRTIIRGGYDCIITPHLFPAEALTHLRRKAGLTVRCYAIATDYTCIPFWEETELDRYFIPHPDLISEFSGKGIPAEKITATGIPVSHRFRSHTDKKAARAALNLPESGNVYLIMTGSMGFGKVNLLVAQLLTKLASDEYIIVICGNNQRLRKIMHTAFGRHPQIRILGYTEHISAYMDACDVIFTKPGGLTSTEAAVKGIPIIHTKPIPGCEEKNLAFFTEHGMSVTGRSLNELIRCGQSLLHDRKRQDEMRRKQRETLPEDAAANIWRFLRKLSGETVSPDVSQSTKD